MKEIAIVLLLVALQTLVIVQGQIMPDIELKTVDGVSISSNEILDVNAPTVVFFWKEGSIDCSDDLDDLQEVWLEDLQQKGVKMVAVCTDCHGSWGQVKPYASGKDWEFEIYIDSNGEFKRSMNVSSIPSAMLYDKDSKLMCRQNGFTDSDAYILCERIAQSIKIQGQDQATK